MYVSEIIGKRYQVRQGWVKFEDGVIYSPKEIELIRCLVDEQKKQVHTVKNIFGGEVIKHIDTDSLNWLRRK